MSIYSPRLGVKQTLLTLTSAMLLLASQVAQAAPTCSVLELAPDEGGSGVTAIGDKGQIAGWTRSATREIYSTVMWRGLQAEVLNDSLPTCGFSEGPARISAISPNETLAGSLSECTVSQGTYWVKVKGKAAVKGPQSLANYGFDYMPTGVSDAGSVVGLVSDRHSELVSGVFASDRSHSQIISPEMAAQFGTGNGGLIALASGVLSLSDPMSSVAYSGASWIDAEKAMVWSQSKPMGSSDAFLAYRSAARNTWIAADEINVGGSAVVVQNRLTGAETSRFLPAKGAASYRLHNAVLSASGQWLSFGEKPRNSLQEQTIYIVQLRNGKPQGSPVVVADVFSHSGGITFVSDQGHLVAQLTPQPLPFLPPEWYVRLPSGTVVRPVEVVPGLSRIDKILMSRQGEMAVAGLYNGKSSALRMTCFDSGSGRSNH